MSSLQTKHGTWFLKRWEDKYLRCWLTPRLPRWIETNHLTLLTIPVAFLCLLGGYLAQYNIAWLWLVNFGVFAQYVTDVLDGAVGRYRNTGLIKWGFYMDHTLDFLMFTGIAVGYSFITSIDHHWIIVLIMGLISVYYIQHMLYYALTEKMEIALYGFGPSEGRFLFILINTLVIYKGKEYIPVILWIVTLLLIGMVTISIYNKQKEMWKLDKEKK